MGEVFSTWIEKHRGVAPHLAIDLIYGWYVFYANWQKQKGVARRVALHLGEQNHANAWPKNKAISDFHLLLHNPCLEMGLHIWDFQEQDSNSTHQLQSAFGEWPNVDETFSMWIEKQQRVAKSTLHLDEQRKSQSIAHPWAQGLSKFIAFFLPCWHKNICYFPDIVHELIGDVW